MDSILRRIFGWRSLSNIGTERLYYLLNALYKCLNPVCLGMDRSILSLGIERNSLPPVWPVYKFYGPIFSNVNNQISFHASIK